MKKDEIKELFLMSENASTLNPRRNYYYYKAKHFILPSLNSGDITKSDADNLRCRTSMKISNMVIATRVISSFDRQQDKFFNFKSEVSFKDMLICARYCTPFLKLNDTDVIEKITSLESKIRSINILYDKIKELNIDLNNPPDILYDYLDNFIKIAMCCYFYLPDNEKDKVHYICSLKERLVESDRKFYYLPVDDISVGIREHNYTDDSVNNLYNMNYIKYFKEMYSIRLIKSYLSDAVGPSMRYTLISEIRDNNKFSDSMKDSLVSTIGTLVRDYTTYDYLYILSCKKIDITHLCFIPVDVFQDTLTLISSFCSLCDKDNLIKYAVDTASLQCKEKYYIVDNETVTFNTLLQGMFDALESENIITNSEEIELLNKYRR